VDVMAVTGVLIVFSCHRSNEAALLARLNSLLENAFAAAKSSRG
jgi:hypothetical protein